MSDDTHDCANHTTGDDVRPWTREEYLQLRAMFDGPDTRTDSDDQE